VCQGKQGTGKTYSAAYYAWNNKLPFFLFSMFEDFKLPKLFGDKTIINGSIKFQESTFVKATQGPCVILFDEINALSNANTFDFHALLQNRELFIKDANDGAGRVYHLHEDCKICFAQNPKSAKYIGGNIKASNFLGRCTYLTYPEFSKKEIRLALRKKFPELNKDDMDKFVKFYFACTETIEKASVPVDISIRQLNNVVDLWLHGLPIQYAIEDGLTSVMEAVSQPKAKDTFFRLAQAVWKELLGASKEEKVNKDEE
jgi:midasin (ATPase involved in ribosome maturation)